ncbi:hypothetical protein V2A60_009825 [Cordyceps javanica]
MHQADPHDEPEHLPDPNQDEPNTTVSDHPLRETDAARFGVRSTAEANMKRRIEAGADISRATYDGVTLLHNAAANGWISVSKMLLDAGADPNARNVDEETPLHVAARFGDAFVAELLIEAGADASAADCYGNTALHIAAAHSFADIVRLLLDAGVDPATANNNGDSVLHHAMPDASAAALDFVLDRVVAAAPGVLVSSVTGESGDTLLHRAVQRRRSAPSGLVPRLLALGSDPGAANDEGETPLHAAAAWGRAAQVAALLQAAGGAGAGFRVGVDSLDNRGATPLHRAAESGEPESLRILIAAGADVGARTNDGETALYLTLGCPSGHYGRPEHMEENARILIDAGADVNAQTKSGETVLDRARKEECDSMVRILERFL